MNFLESFRIALTSLTSNKLRASLTMLGIIVGIAAIIATLAIGYGAEKKMREKITALGNNYIEMWAGRSFLEGATSTKLKPPQSLTTDDIDSFKLQCSEIKHISPFFWNQETIEYQGIPMKAIIKGGNEDLLKTLGRKIKKGSFFTKDQVRKGSRVIILGSKAATELFKSFDPIGQTVKVKNIHFTVIGVIDKIKVYFEGNRNPNLETFTPFTTSKKYFHHSTSNKIHGIIIAARSLDVMPKLVKQLKTILRARYQDYRSRLPPARGVRCRA